MVSPEEFIIFPKKKPSKKILVKGEPKNKTKRKPGIKKKKLLIVDSDTEKV